MKLSVFYDHILQAAEQTGRAIPDLLNEVSRAGIEAAEINMTYLREHEETADRRHFSAPLTKQKRLYKIKYNLCIQ